MDGLISKQAAIDALERKKDKNAKGDIGGFYNKIIQNDIDALMQLPSAQPEQKTAEWIEHKYECECSSCHEEWDYCDNDVDRFIYCPNCGAKIK